MKANSILVELSEQLPKTAQTFKAIQFPESYEDIIVQAKTDLFCFRKIDGVMEDGRLTKTVLQQSGYEEWLKQIEHEEDEGENCILEVIGALNLIIELAEELAED